ncbi:hypothetical protein RSK20926_07077 [Roseobacter sp. SK209-2-6]|nr:hypothetical protein RSK20926_07077 [Roseobacter sp. SK209-2-6]
MVRRSEGVRPCPFSEIAARDDHVDVGMMCQSGTPDGEHAGHADPGTKTLRISSDGRHCLSRCFERQAVNSALVPKSDPGDLRW